METTKQLINYFYRKSFENETFVKENFSLLSEKQINWKPAFDIWGVGECIHHLIVCHKTYHPKIIDAFGLSTPGERDEYPYKHSFIGKWIIKGVDPVVNRKHKTFKVFKPDTSDFTKKIFNDFIEVLKQTGELVSKMKKMDLKKIKINSPVSNFLQINLGDPLIILAHHDARHLYQAKRVTLTEGFPVS